MLTHSSLYLFYNVYLWDIPEIKCLMSYVLFQWVLIVLVIPMGTNCAPLVADLYEAKFVYIEIMSRR